MLTVLLCLLPFRVEAQFMRLEITIDAEFNIVKQRNPGKYPVAPGSGWVELRGDEAGRLDIRAEENAHFVVTIDAPDELVLDEANSMSFRTEPAYSNNTPGNLRDTIPFDGNTARFPISDSGLLAEDIDSVLLQSTIFLFGAFRAGNISPGQYRGEITVTVEYL